MWLDHYVMTPFKDGGRSFDGADCFGLYMLLLQNEAGIALPEPSVSYRRSAKAVESYVEAQMVCGDWIKIAEGNGAVAKPLARKFDLVVLSAHVRVGLSVHKADLHVGCALGDGKMIHTEDGVGPAVLSLDDDEVIDRVRFVFRPKLLAERVLAA